MLCFKKDKRLLKKHQYDRVFSQAKKNVTKDFIFLFSSNDMGYARLGLAISKKVVAKAHDRNKLKRLIRESFRVRTLPAVDVIVLARKNVGRANQSDIARRLGQAWDKLSVLCK